MVTHNCTTRICHMQHTCLCERYVYASCLCINRIWDRFKSESETDSSQEQTQLVQHTLTCSECIVAARKTTARQCHLEPCITCVITCWRGEHIHKNVYENHSWMWWGGLVRLQRHQECYNLLELKRIHSHSGIAVNLLPNKERGHEKEWHTTLLKKIIRTTLLHEV